MDENQVETKLDEHHSRLQSLEVAVSELYDKLKSLVEGKPDPVPDAQAHAMAGIATAEHQEVLAEKTAADKAAVETVA
jgi:hypothetical protein